MYALYYYPNYASLAPHILLHELGVPFELVRVDVPERENWQPDYMSLNPNGLVPTLLAGDLVLYETAAILLHLADCHPGPLATPQPGTPARALLYRWLMHLTNTPQAEYRPIYRPENCTTDRAGIFDVKAAGIVKLEATFERIAGLLGAGPWLLGDDYSAADPLLYTLIRWDEALTRPARNMPALRDFVSRMEARPAVRAALAAEGEPALLAPAC